ncbi:cation efflux family protein [Pseudonocardia hierapolitana]|uniref:Cation efflux family protein n=1 Tax=Pseudonocardia hierapolitana TaxID=1128676 RepID=A0A561T4E4_9PSEU|nr:cation efflux family protein [Pseudonocardia hierapolitana]
MSIFVSGAVFAIIEGVRTILGEDVEQTLAWVAYAVLAVSFVLEGISWLQAVRQVRVAARAESTTPLRWLRATDDPTVRSVFYEDSAALIGLLLAFGGVGLHQLTGSSFWDGLASLLVGLLLTAVAYILGRTNMGLLIGRQADRATVLALRDTLAACPEVDEVVDLLTMTTGTDQVLLCARLDFADAIGVAQLERAAWPSTRSCTSGSRICRRCSWSRCRAPTPSCAGGCWSATAAAWPTASARARGSTATPPPARPPPPRRAGARVVRAGTARR